MNWGPFVWIFWCAAGVVLRKWPATVPLGGGGCATLGVGQSGLRSRHARFPIPPIHLSDQAPSDGHDEIAFGAYPPLTWTQLQNDVGS